MNTNNSQIAHSSQTAPIKEFRVMWTQQKKQKLKKWHDGTLRFHTFNNRMLLYDEGRTLITDKYLKPGTIIDEGDEVEFEQHLATIEEFLKTVIQDLTPVFAPAVQRQQQRAAIAARNAMSPARTPAQRMNIATPASRMSVPTPRIPGPQTPMRPPQTLRTPQTYRPMNHGASSIPPQPVQRRPIPVQTPAPAHRISAPLPSLPSPQLYQPPPTRNPPVQQPPPPVRNAPWSPPQQYPPSRPAPQPVSREYPPPCRAPGPISPIRPPPPPPRQQISPPAPPRRLPPQPEPRPPPSVIQVRASPELESPVRPNPPRPPPPPRPRFSPPRPILRPPQDPPPPPPPPPLQKHPTPFEPPAPPQPSLQESPAEPAPQNQRPTPISPIEKPRVPTPPEPSIIRLSDPYKKRNKLFCPPRRESAKLDPPPRKRARTTAPDSDSDSDPFEAVPTPHKPKPPEIVPGLVGARGAGTSNKRKGKQVPSPPPPSPPFRKEQPKKSLAERQTVRSSYDATGAWSIEAADLFEWKPPGMRR
ncbi:hypothetical protein BDD12DRAFT_246554 [Trichophaea hybrida]|nr:hypothetical protein BDD12DRAFT_246554 [Trichophaea hybrida]